LLAHHHEQSSSAYPQAAQFLQGVVVGRFRASQILILLHVIAKSIRKEKGTLLRIWIPRGTQ
jgi:hypothetical protein